MDVCEGLGGGLVTGLCRLQLPGNASVFSLPYGLATGMEQVCSSLEESGAAPRKDSETADTKVAGSKMTDPLFVAR